MSMNNTRRLTFTAARLGVSGLVDRMVAAGCTEIDLSALERRADYVAAARHSAATYRRTTHAPMPGIAIGSRSTPESPRVQRTAVRQPLSANHAWMPGVDFGTTLG